MCIFKLNPSVAIALGGVDPVKGIYCIEFDPVIKFGVDAVGLVPLKLSFVAGVPLG